MTNFDVRNGMGASVRNPTEPQMRRFLDELDPTDEEHGAVWVSTEQGLVLEWAVDGRLVFDSLGPNPPRHMIAVSKERTLELWVALASGRIDDVEACPWKPGNGYVLTPEKERQLQEARLAHDRRFYDSLGAERPGTRCRTAGCSRGTVEFSVFCRVHHFESIQHGPCPFDH